MSGFDTVPEPYLTDWDTWNWMIALLVLTIGLALGAFVVTLGEALGPWGALAAGIAVPGVIFLVTIPKILRHLPHTEWVGTALLIGLLASAGLAVSTFFQDPPAPTAYIPAGTLAVASLIFTALEGINRLAASIPMSVGGLVVLALIAVGVVMTQSRR
ncbi:MAG: hypothetical protein ACTH2Q_21380 [Propionibacteriaceae bacterium]